MRVGYDRSPSRLIVDGWRRQRMTWLLPLGCRDASTTSSIGGTREAEPRRIFNHALHQCLLLGGAIPATADRIGRVVVWEVESGRPLARIEAPEFYTFDRVQRNRSIGGIRALAFSPDSSELAVGGIGQVRNVDGFDGKVRIDRFDWRNEVRTGGFESDRHKGIVEHLIYDKDYLLATGGSGKGFFIVLNPLDGKVLADPEAPMHVHEVVLDSPQEIVGVGHKKIARWSVGTASV